MSGSVILFFECFAPDLFLNHYLLRNDLSNLSQSAAQKLARAQMAQTSATWATAASYVRSVSQTGPKLQVGSASDVLSTLTTTSYHLRSVVFCVFCCYCTSFLHAQSGNPRSGIFSQNSGVGSTRSHLFKGSTLHCTVCSAMSPQST